MNAAGDERERAEQRPTATKRQRPSASVPSGLITSVDVTKTMMASGMRMTAIVLNCRRR